MTEPQDQQPAPAPAEPAEAVPAAVPAAGPAAAPTGAPAGPAFTGGPPQGGRPPFRKKREFRGKYVPRRKVCAFCADKSLQIDYKDVGRLRRFLSDRGKIEPRRKTGTCARHQRTLGMALKRARFIALLPYTAEHIRVSGGPPLGRSGDRAGY